MTHAYTKDQFAKQPTIGLSVTISMCPAAKWGKILCESLAGDMVNHMFLNTFLFEWKTSE